MALSRDKKEELVQGYGEKLARAQAVIWSHYRGISVARSTAFRRSLRAVGAEAVVVKNTLMCIALEQANMPTTEELMAGPFVLTFIYDDVAPAAKVVTDFARDNAEQFQIVGGLMGGRLANEEQVRSLTTMPSREVMLAQVVGTIQAPISSFVGVLAAVIRSVLYVLDARSKQLEGSAG